METQRGPKSGRQDSATRSPEGVREAQTGEGRLQKWEGSFQEGTRSQEESLRLQGMAPGESCGDAE